MNHSRLCPYADCHIRASSSGCADKRTPVVFPAEDAHYGLCPNDQVKRIVRSCPKPGCGATNQLLADYCRICGQALTPSSDGGAGLNVFWDAPAQPPVHPEYFKIPQLLLRGDLLVSSQDLDLVFTAIANGKTLIRMRAPGPPRFSATPIAVKDRIYSCAPGFMWELRLVSREEQRTPLKGFEPSETAMPLHLQHSGRDFIIVPGKVGSDGRAIILAFDTQSRQFAIRRLRLRPGDTIHTGVRVSRNGAIFTTRLGALFSARLGSGPHLHVVVGKIEEPPNLPGKRYCSAPAFSHMTRSVFVEYVDAQTLDRGMLIMSSATRTTYPLGTPPDKLDEAEIDLLIFSPIVCGSHVITRSAIPGMCHFVALGNATVVPIGGLEMDPVATAAGGGKIVSVGSMGEVQKFDGVPVQQNVNAVGIGALAGSMAVNRPVYYLRKIFLQTQNRLIGWEV